MIPAGAGCGIRFAEQNGAPLFFARREASRPTIYALLRETNSRMNHDRRLRSLAASNPLRASAHWQHALNRRQVLAGLAAAGLAAAGCSPGGGGERPLALLTWDAYADPRLLKQWRDETGKALRYEIHVSDPTSVNRLRAGETAVWDFVNLNNPWARKELWPVGLIRDLPRERFEPLYNRMFEKFAPPYHWAMSADGDHLLGVVQRFETFDFVVNSKVISPATAKNIGWDLFNDPAMAGRYGILAYEDWNVMDICMGADIHPFRDKTADDYSRFELEGIDKDRQLLVIDLDQLHGISRNVTVLGNDESNFLTLEEHLLVSQDRLHVAGKRRHIVELEGLKIGGRQYGDNTGNREGRLGINRLDARMTVWRTDKVAEQHARQLHVIDVVALALGKPCILDALALAAESLQFRRPFCGARRFHGYSAASLGARSCSAAE